MNSKKNFDFPMRSSLESCAIEQNLKGVTIILLALHQPTSLKLIFRPQDYNLRVGIIACATLSFKVDCGLPRKL